MTRFVAIQSGQRTAVSDLDVDVGLLEILWLELLPLHAPNSRSLVKGHPAFELVIGHVMFESGSFRNLSDWSLQFKFEIGLTELEIGERFLVRICVYRWNGLYEM